MFFLLHVDAVPNLECLYDTIVIILFEAIQLDHCRVFGMNLQFVAFRCFAPVRRTDLVAVESEGFAVFLTTRFPAESALR